MLGTRWRELSPDCLARFGHWGIGDAGSCRSDRAFGWNEPETNPSPWLTTRVQRGGHAEDNQLHSRVAAQFPKLWHPGFWSHQGSRHCNRFRCLFASTHYQGSPQQRGPLRLSLTGAARLAPPAGPSSVQRLISVLRSETGAGEPCHQT